MPDLALPPLSSRAPSTLLGLLLVALLASACGPNYAGQVEAMREQMKRGNLQGALKEVNNALGVDRAEDLPNEETELTPLLLLERATLLQALQRYDLSKRDFQQADDRIEVLDLSESTADDLAQYLFSDALGDYKTAPYEKLLINSFNLLNYLAKGDLRGAKVEARRIDVLAEYFEGTEGGTDIALGLGAYLAGFTYEQLKDPGEALRWYSTATQLGDFPSAEYAIGYLLKQRNLKDDHVQAVGKRFAEATPPADNEGDVLIIIQAGVAPYRISQRIPIGLALTLTASNQGRWAHTRAQRNRANRLAAEGLFKWVNYPDLTEGYALFDRFSVLLPDGQQAPLKLALDVRGQAVRYFESIKPKLVGAAITRLLTRTAASIATEQAVKGASGDSGSASVIGFLAGKVLEGAMTAADTPDTRSWNTLPFSIFVSRVRLPAGEQRLRIRASGRGGRVDIDETITVRPGGWNTVVVRTF